MWLHLFGCTNLPLAANMNTQRKSARIRERRIRELRELRERRICELRERRIREGRERLERRESRERGMSLSPLLVADGVSSLPHPRFLWPIACGRLLVAESG
jgi:hypothetical protein